MWMGVRVVEEDEVDIAGVVEFAGAELAHAEDDEAATGLGGLGVGEEECARLVGGEDEVGDGEVEGGFGEGGESAGDLGEGPEAADVGEGGDQRDLALGAAQGGGDHGAGGRRGSGLEEVHGGCEGGVGTFVRQGFEAGVLADGKVGEEGAAAADGREHGGAVGGGGEGGGGGAAGREALYEASSGFGVGGFGPFAGGGHFGGGWGWGCVGVNGGGRGHSELRRVGWWDAKARPTLWGWALVRRC